MMGIHEVTDEELPRYIEFLTETFYPRSISDGSIAFLLAKSQEKLEKFIAELKYNGDAFIVLDDETIRYFRCMMKSWPFRLEKYRLSTMKAYRYAGKQENPFQWSCHEGMYVAKLQLEHAGFISDYWLCGEPEARREMLKYVIKNITSVGVFLRSDPTHPVSWTLLSNYGHIMHVYTLEEHRRKGYAKIAVLSLIEQILESGLTPAAEIAAENVASIKLFTGLGFVESYVYCKWKQFIQSEK